MLLESAEAALADGDHEDALVHAERAVELDGFGERAHRAAMLALYALGRQHDALAAYERVRRLLDEELGLPPTRETRALHTAVLKQVDPATLLPRPIRRRAPRAPDAPPLIDRVDELDEIVDALGAGVERSFALVLVEGEAGAGKSRLLTEAVARLPGVRVGRATCSELERHLPYVPLAIALREALADVPLSAAVRPALRGILPELALDEPASPPDELQVLESLVDLATEHGPLVLVLDDLQWADERTLAAAGYLHRRGARLPGAVLAAARSEEADAGHPVRRLDFDARVALGPLAREDVEALGVPDLYRRTGGQPRFVAAAMAGGARSDLARALAETVIARCRAEGPRAYGILLGAAVLDQPFEPGGLASVLLADADELTEELERLCDRRLLGIAGLGFRFRYDVVRQILCQTVSPARRKLLRERALRAGGSVSPVLRMQGAQA